MRCYSSGQKHKASSAPKTHSLPTPHPPGAKRASLAAPNLCVRQRDQIAENWGLSDESPPNPIGLHRARASVPAALNTHNPCPHPPPAPRARRRRRRRHPTRNSRKSATIAPLFWGHVVLMAWCWEALRKDSGKRSGEKKRLEGWTRTTDRPDYSRALYQLSYCQFPGPPARLRRHPDGAAGAMSALSPRGVLEGFESFLRACFAKAKTKSDTFSIFACHPCAGAMLIFSVSFQFLRMTPKSSETGVVGSPNRRGGGSMGALWLDPPSLPSPRAPGPSSLPV